MAPRHSWFDSAQLLPEERLLRESRARLRTPHPPFWWDGALVLTSDRLFFLPTVPNDLIGDAAFWLADIIDCNEAGARRLHVATAERTALFELLPALSWRPARAWAARVITGRRRARRAEAFDDWLPRAG
jgi:hypothetical protein